MSNDDHPRASSPVPQPLHASNGGSQAPAPQPPQSFSQDRQVPQPTAHQPPRRTKLGRQVLAVLVTLVAVLVIGALAGILYGLSVRSTYIHVRHPDPTPEATAPQIEADPTPVGYQGTATTTTELSPAWSSGLATAWTLPTDPDSLVPQLIAEGTTLFAVAHGVGANTVTTVTAYDISDNEPVTLWTTTGPATERVTVNRTPAYVSTDDQLLIDGLIVDKASGQQTLAPWDTDLPVGVSEGNLVTCDTITTCAGWTRDSGTWTQRWSSTTSLQRSSGLLLSTITKLPTAVIGSGVNAAIILPIDESRFAPQIVDPRTGAVTTIGSPPASDSSSRPVIVAASDGLVVRRDKADVAYDATGQVVWAVEKKRLSGVPSYDRRPPTLSELKEFFRNQPASWTTATVHVNYHDQYYAGRAHDDTTLSVTNTDSGTSCGLYVSGDFLSSKENHGSFEASDVRATSDGSAVYLRVTQERGPQSFFVDMNGEVVYTSHELNQATNLTWAFDDLLIGVTDGQLMAFTPKAS